jgi:hypothetical protein
MGMMGDMIDAMVIFPMFGVGLAGYMGLKAMGYKGTMDLSKMQAMANRVKSAAKK